MFFENRRVDLVKIWVIPALKILADSDYQERAWVDESNSGTSSFNEFLEDFLISLPKDCCCEEYDLDKKNITSLQEIRQSVDEFTLSPDCMRNDMHSLINHPKWAGIRSKAVELLEVLIPIVDARTEDIIEVYLIPSLEKLADPTYQERVWLSPKDLEGYWLWLDDFSRICDFLLVPDERTLDEKYKPALSQLYKNVDQFDDSIGRRLDKEENIQLLISNPEWIEIQNQAATFLEILKKK